MAFFLTGGSGFIGSHLFKALQDEQVPIVALTHKRSVDSSPTAHGFKVVQGDITTSDWVERVDSPIEVIYHLAGLTAPAQGIEDPLAMTKTNLLGTQQVLEAARRWKVQRVVIASSSYVYGAAPSYPLKEDLPLRPTSPLGAAKAGMEALCQAYGYCYGIPFTLLRIFTVYGPGSGSHQFVFQAVQKVREAKGIRFGNPEPTRDFIFITDVIRAFLSARSVQEPGAIFNVGTGVETSIRQFVELLVGIAGRSMEEVTFDEGVIRRDERTVVSRQVASLDQVQKGLAWAPRVSLEEGLRMTYRAAKESVRI